jgi:hypothetical protein
LVELLDIYLVALRAVLKVVWKVAMLEKMMVGWMVVSMDFLKAV